MTRQPFTLIPFACNPAADDFKVNGLVERSVEKLIIDYSLEGPLDRLFLRPPAKMSVRKDRLWEETCFECFIGADSKSRYWEINLSPAGHWNVYQFDDYRAGMKEASACSLLPSVPVSAPDQFKMRCEVDLNTLGLANTEINIGPCAILMTTDLKVVHWAMAHPDSKPDFHRQDGFKLHL